MNVQNFGYVKHVYILHENNAEKLLKNCQNNNCAINNPVTFHFFIPNEFIDFSESIWIFSIFSYVFDFFLNFEKERNVTKCGNVFVYQTHEFFRRLNVQLHVCSLNFCLELGIFKNVKKNWKNSYGVWTINKFYKMRKTY